MKSLFTGLQKCKVDCRPLSSEVPVFACYNNNDDDVDDDDDDDDDVLICASTDINTWRFGNKSAQD